MSGPANHTDVKSRVDYVVNTQGKVARRRVQYIREGWQNLTRRDSVGGKSGTAEGTLYKGGVAELEEGGEREIIRLSSARFLGLGLVSLIGSDLYKTTGSSTSGQITSLLTRPCLERGDIPT